MTIANLKPNAAGDLTELTPYPGAGEANYQNVDDSTGGSPPLYGSDGDSTYNSNEASSPNNVKEDLYNIESLPAGVASITNVKVYTVARRYSAGGSPYSGNLYIVIKTGGTEYQSDSKMLLSSYTFSNYSWATNPQTGVAWTIADVNALQVGASLQATFGADPNQANHPRLTQVYVEVTYDPIVAPTVTTQAVTAISGTTATGNGNITSLGVPSPTQHGHCWNTTGTPTTADSKTENGASSATGAFTSAISGLVAGTIYYVRAYATNDGGTSYGGSTSFKADVMLGSEQSGLIAVVETRLHYVDAYGTERYFEGTVVV